MHLTNEGTKTSIPGPDELELEFYTIIKKHSKKIV